MKMQFFAVLRNVTLGVTVCPNKRRAGLKNDATSPVPAICMKLRRENPMLRSGSPPPFAQNEQSSFRFDMLILS